ACPRTTDDIPLYLSSDRFTKKFHVACKNAADKTTSRTWTDIIYNLLICLLNQMMIMDLSQFDKSTAPHGSNLPERSGKGKRDG
ncbi:MAG: hypothetical protein V2I35_08735, partial [Desulfocapsaceae bacterium]|nr:hypothetical protein [Desulfocapsaceae bacterium]